MNAETRRSPRYYVSLVSLHLIVLSLLFLAQDLTVGFLPVWNTLRVGPVPIRPFVFLVTSVMLSRRYVRVVPRN